MKKILLVTDSLSLPRVKPEICAFDDTWPELLKKLGDYKIHQLSLGGVNLINASYSKIGYYKL